MQVKKQQLELDMEGELCGSSGPPTGPGPAGCNRKLLCGLGTVPTGAFLPGHSS